MVLLKGKILLCDNFLLIELTSYATTQSPNNLNIFNHLLRTIVSFNYILLPFKCHKYLHYITYLSQVITFQMSQVFTLQYLPFIGSIYSSKVEKSAVFTLLDLDQFFNNHVCRTYTLNRTMNSIISKLMKCFISKETRSKINNLWQAQWIRALGLS